MLHPEIELTNDCSEIIINKKLGDLIKECKELFYTDDFKRSDAAKTEETELDTLGIIISKYCEFNANRIEKVALSAFEDSNFTATIEY